MSSLAELLQQGSAHGWLFVPTAIALGALHGLEPGHSKSLMAAFIVAVRGTVKQAIMLGLAATVSHTAVVWVVALIGMYLGRNHGMEAGEPYFQLASAVLILAIGGWMVYRIWKNNNHHAHDGHSHSHDDHDHSGDIERRFARKQVTNGEIILFGLTGGLIPCPAAITVLILCLQLQQIVLGMALVLCFSIGLALTLVASGIVAALGMRAASKRWEWVPCLLHRAPYFAGGITILIGCYIGIYALLEIL